MSVRIINVDCREALAGLPSGSARCCVTSPPYFGLRDYGTDRQIGLEATPDEYVAALVGVFREVRRVLADDGTLWLNLGDSYAGSGKGGNPGDSPHIKQRSNEGSLSVRAQKQDCPHGLKPKDLIGIPWMVAFALRADGWYLRGDHVWGKPNGMPESVTDRPTRGHEFVFLLSKSPHYFYDTEAVRTAPKADSTLRLKRSIAADGGESPLAGGAYAPPGQPANAKARRSDKERGHTRRHAGFNDRWAAMERAEQINDGANLRSVWWISPAQYAEAHFAVMPDLLAEICIRAGSALGDTILDPFGGAGTTALVADRLGRSAVLCESNPEYAEMARLRIAGDAPLFTEVA